MSIGQGTACGAWVCCAFGCDECVCYEMGPILYFPAMNSYLSMLRCVIWIRGRLVCKGKENTRGSIEEQK